MKWSRITLASIAVTILVLAVDFAIVREAMTSHLATAIAALYLIPMLDILVVRLHRLRRPGRRAAGPVAFIVAGTIASTAILAASSIAPDATFHGLRRVGSPISRAIQLGMARAFGPAAMRTPGMQLTLGLLLEILIPMALFSGASLAVALAAGWLGRGWRSRFRPRAGQPTTETQPEPAGRSGRHLQGELGLNGLR